MSFESYFIKKIKEGIDISAESNKRLLVALKLIEENKKCSNYDLVISLPLDICKNFGVRYYCKVCKKRFEPRKFTAFEEIKLKAGDILRIICLLADECSVSKISSRCLLSKAAVQKVVTIARCAILKHVYHSQPVVGDGNERSL